MLTSHLCFKHVCFLTHIPLEGGWILTHSCNVIQDLPMFLPVWQLDVVRNVPGFWNILWWLNSLWLALWLRFLPWTFQCPWPWSIPMILGCLEEFRLYHNSLFFYLFCLTLLSNSICFFLGHTIIIVTVICYLIPIFPTTSLSPLLLIQLEFRMYLITKTIYKYYTSHNAQIR